MYVQAVIFSEYSSASGFYADPLFLCMQVRVVSMHNVISS